MASSTGLSAFSSIFIQSFGLDHDQYHRSRRARLTPQPAIPSKSLSLKAMVREPRDIPERLNPRHRGMRGWRAEPGARAQEGRSAPAAAAAETLMNSRRVRGASADRLGLRPGLRAAARQPRVREAGAALGVQRMLEVGRRVGTPRDGAVPEADPRGAAAEGDAGSHLRQGRRGG